MRSEINSCHKEAIIMNVYPVSDLLPIISLHHDNPIIKPLIDDFLKTIPERLKELVRTASMHDLENFKAISHKFRGALTLFGFPQISRALVDCERMLASPCDSDGQLSQPLSKLVSQCQRISGLNRVQNNIETLSYSRNAISAKSESLKVSEHGRLLDSESL